MLQQKYNYAFIPYIREEYYRQFIIEKNAFGDYFGEEYKALFEEEEQRLHYKYKHLDIFHWLGLFTFQEIKARLFRTVLKKVTEADKKKQEEKVQ